MLIDLPQLADLFADPAWPEYLERDVACLFIARGLDVDLPELVGRLRAQAGLQ